MIKKLIVSIFMIIILLQVNIANTNAGINEISIKVNGNYVEFPDAKPFINDENRTMVPVRFISEALGAKVTWEEETRTVIISKDNMNIELPIESKKIIVDKTEYTMDTMAVIVNNRTMVPVRFPSEYLGSEVGWDEINKEVIINSQSSNMDEAIYDLNNTSTSHEFYVDNETRTDIALGNKWPDASSELYNENSGKLKEAVTKLDQLGFVRSLIVVHDNKLVIEKYFDEVKSQDSENIHSASKSILSALVGIAINEGYIQDVNQSISNFLPAKYFEDKNREKKDITIHHLLAMTSGIKWHENDTEYDISGDEDWIHSIISLEQVHTPGNVFNYSTGNTHLLSAILTNATGMPLKEFAEKYMFEDMDISVEYWHTDPNGYYSGGCNLFITPIEMAKFGQLYLNQGTWNENQIISKDWIDISFNNINNDEYGYLWWLNNIDSYDVKTAWGFSGQMIHVVPELDLVVVMTTDSNNKEAYENEDYSFEILEEYIFEIFHDKRF